MAPSRTPSPIDTSNRHGSLAGRQREFEQIDHFLFEGRARAIVLTGVGGIGKTTLAQAYGLRTPHRFDEVLTIDRHLTPALETTEPSRLSRLYIVDNLDASTEQERDLVVRAVLHRLETSPEARAIFVSRFQYSLLSRLPIVALSALDRASFEDLLQGMIRQAPDFNPSLVGELHAVLEGHPLATNLVVGLFATGSVQTIRELLTKLRHYSLSSPFGTGGSALSRPSQQKIFVDVTNANEELFRLLKKEPSLVQSLPPRKFEEIVCEILKKMGYDASLTPQSKDGGFDIYAARKEGLGRFLYLVECKRFVPPNKVGVHIVRSLHGVLQEKRANAAAIVTTSYFTAGAKEYRSRIQHQMHLHDYISLQKWIDELTLPSKQ